MKTYSTTRYPFLPKRKLVWKEICAYLNRNFILKDSRVLEIGSGYGDFIMNIRARERVAIEQDIQFREYLNHDVDITVHFSDALSILRTMPKNSFDVVFCSNFFEHFEISTIREYLHLITDVLNNGGRLIVLQPNYQLCPKFYFDDWTHISIFSHTSFVDFLEVHGFRVETCLKRFLPFSMKSDWPVSRLLVRLYLNSPIKPFAGQFLVVASVEK